MLKARLFSGKGGNRSAIVSILLGCALLMLFIRWAVHAQPGERNPLFLIESTNNCVPVSTNVVCAPEPGPQFLSATATNQCAHPMILANATCTNIPGMVITTITYSNNACPPLVTTQQVSSAILTNWWAATGTADPWTHPGLGAAFDVTDCEGGTVDFFITYSNSPPCGSNTTTISKSVDYALDRDCTNHFSGPDEPAGGMGCRPGDSWMCCETNSLCGDSFNLTCDGSVHLNGPGGECGHCPYPHTYWSASFAFCLCRAKIMKTFFSVYDWAEGDTTYGHWKKQWWFCAGSCSNQCYTVLTWSTNSQGVPEPLTSTTNACGAVDQ